MFLRVTTRSTQRFSITRPNAIATAVKAKVATGQYATESEVIRDGPRVPLTRNRVVDCRLRGEVTRVFGALKTDPSPAPSADRVRARLAAEHKTASAEA